MQIHDETGTDSTIRDGGGANGREDLNKGVISSKPHTLKILQQNKMFAIIINIF